jgi:hypothetical protein
VPIVAYTEHGTRRMLPNPYENEAELQAMLAEHPALLVTDHEPMVALVRREFSVPGAGPVDLLLVDADGRPIIVEVKLSRNPEIRRQVAAQVLDYVSSLAQLTVDELDQAAENALELALRSFDGGSDENNDDAGTNEPHGQDGGEHWDGDSGFRRRWQACGTNLRAGQVRVVVAVDEPRDDVIRIMRFINDHTDLDVRLVSVQRYADNLGTTILVPSFLVHTASAAPRTPGSTARGLEQEMSPALRAVVEAYAKAPQEDYCLRGQARMYRQVRPDGWPSGLHYEFVDSPRRGVSVELHLENDAAHVIAGPISGLVEQLSDAFTDAEIVWDPQWSRNRGRLRVFFPENSSAEEIAAAMCSLIERTAPIVAQGLQEHTAAKVNRDGSSPSSIAARDA